MKLAPLGVTVVALWTMVVPGLASAQSPQQSEDSIVGTGGFFDPNIFSVSVDAHSGPSGENPRGSFSRVGGTPTFSASITNAAVTCLAISGNTAVVGVFGTLNRSGTTYFDNPYRPGAQGYDPPPPTPAGLFAYFQDNGFSSYEAPIDRVEFVQGAFFSHSVYSSTPLTDCSAAPPPPLVWFNPLFGDVVIHDVPPLPMSKEQCKKDGWRTYGSTFKNQGQCVAFVQRGPKP